ncbi:two-component regulator propeller domain-containing protein [Lacinutrix salivirga]
MQKYITYLFIALFCLVTHVLCAQNTQLRTYTIEDGLPQSQVYDLVQDHNGYLWLGTQGGGLARFDGKIFKVWNESDGLLSNYIKALYSKKDTLFIGTKRGLSIKIKEAFFSSETPQIHQILEHNNTIFLATQQGVYSLNEALATEKINLHPEIDQSLVNQILYTNGFFWIATNTALWRLSDLNKNAEVLQKLETNNFSAITAYNEKIIASTFNDGTFVFDANNFEDNLLMREPLRINSLSIQNNNELWVATDNDGISVVNLETLSEIKKINTQTGLPVQHIRKVITDQQGNIWIATSGGGFLKYFQNNFSHYDVNSGLKGNRIYAVHHKNNSIWVSSSEAGLTKIDSLGIHHYKSPNGFKDVKIKTITSDNKQNIWSGSEGRGILLHQSVVRDSIVLDTIDANQYITKITPYKTYKNHVFNSDTGFPYDWIRKIKVKQDTVYAATYSSGIVKFTFNPKNETLKIHKKYGLNEGIKDLLIKDIIFKQDTLWYATQKGHLGYIANNKVTHLNAVLNVKTEIGTLLFKNNTLFIGTAGKGIWFANSGNYTNFKKLKGDKKLLSENIYQLIFDAEGYLWSGTERGVDKIELTQDNTINDVFHFKRNDGFLGIETCLNAVDIDQKGHLWFGTIYGLTEYIPSKTKAVRLKPELHFSSIKIDYKSIDSLLNKTETLQLNPKQRQLSFTYKTVDLDHPNDIQYRTKLDAANWSPWTADNTQNLSGLAYGNHTFKAQSRNNRWQESEVINFSFYITSPIYKQPWFLVLLFTLTAVIIGLAIWYYIKRLKRKNKEEQAQLKLKNHLLTLEQKALRLQMNPHFIFNVLNGIKAMAISKPDKMNTTINSFATLLRETLINSRKDSVTLNQELKTLKHYIEVEQLMATKPFNYKINVDTVYDPEEILIPPMLIQPFVENAIRHGILKGQKEGELVVSFKTSEEFLHIKITDNGIGIYSSQQSKTKTDHQSMALTVTKARLESISKGETLNITELKNNDGTIKGTEIAFKIPLETEF